MTTTPNFKIHSRSQITYICVHQDEVSIDFYPACREDGFIVRFSYDTQRGKWECNMETVEPQQDVCCCVSFTEEDIEYISSVCKDIFSKFEQFFTSGNCQKIFMTSADDYWVFHVYSQYERFPVYKFCSYDYMTFYPTHPDEDIKDGDRDFCQDILNTFADFMKPLTR